MTSMKTLFFVGFMAALAATAFGQNVAGTVVGGITDSSGAAVTAATVTLINEETNIEYRAAAGETGEYVAPNLPAGTYTVKTELAGFKPTVDLAIVDFDKKQILLARKPNEDLLRFVGGFMDPLKDKCAEDAAIREGKEETGLYFSDAHYVGSTLVDDWRYRRERDKIMTFLYVMRFLSISGTPVASDDIEYVTWKKFGEISEADIMPVHRPLIRMLNDYFKNEVLSLPQKTNVGSESGTDNTQKES